MIQVNKHQILMNQLLGQHQQGSVNQAADGQHAWFSEVRLPVCC